MTQARDFAPVLSTILRDRRLAAAISGAALLQLVLALLRLPGWQCPVFHALGVPCPGCGLTRATVSLFQGNFKQSLALHAFAPIFVTALAIVTCSAVFPPGQRERIANRTESIERYTGITSLILIGLVLYWLARLLILQSGFINLIGG
jgi:hypothetical protein